MIKTPFLSYISRRKRTVVLCVLVGINHSLFCNFFSHAASAFPSESHWISLPGQDLSDSAPAPYFRKEFTLKKAVQCAKIVATAKGIYVLSLNGKRLSDAEFLPGWTDFNKRMYYHEYDATSALISGENVIGVQLGDGWYAGYLGWDPGRQNYGKYLEFLFSMEIVYEDGSSEIIASDHNWKASEGPIRSSDFYHGEHYDARMEMPNWNLAGYPATEWNAVHSTVQTPLPELALAPHPPVKAIEELSPVDCWQVEQGRWIFDLGQNMVGRARIQVPSERGQVVTLRFAEMLEKDRTLYTANYRRAKSMDTYICRGGSGFETWEPAFTFHGFRYVELSGLPDKCKPNHSWLTGVVLHSDIKRIGSFSCSNADLNQLQKNIVWGQKGNFLEVPTDCPQRDERLGWTGDAQVFCPTACFNFDVNTFFQKWMTDVRDAQRQDGGIPHVVPNILGAHEYNSPAWADAAVVVPWEVYVRYGDISILEANFETMLKWIEYLKKNSPGWIRPDEGFGDWLQPYPSDEKNLRGDTERALIGTAYFAYSTELTAKAAAALGKPELSQQLEQLHLEITQAFRERFWRGNHQLTSHTQTAYLLALAFGLLENSQRAHAVENLVQLIENADGHLRTGFVGTPLINRVLSQFGRTDLAYDLLLKESYPGWIYSIRQGATTMWERWNSYSHDNGFGDASMNSFNHYAYGAIGQWMVETVAGLQPDPNIPGYRHFFIAPEPGGNLTWAKAELETSHGVVASEWRMENDSLTIIAKVPSGTTATIIIPKAYRKKVIYQGESLVINPSAQIEVSTGVHTFICSR